MRFGLSTRIFLGFLLALATFAGAQIFATSRVQAIRDELRLVHKGYLSLTRQSAQVRTLQEAKDEYVRRAQRESDPAVQSHLVGYTRDFYPRALRERLAEMEVIAGTLALASATRPEKASLRGLEEKIQRIRALHEHYDQVTMRLVQQLQPIPATGPQTGNEDVSAQPAGQVPAALATEFEEARDALSQEVRDLTQQLDARTAEALLGAENEVRDATFVAWGLSLLGLLMSVGILGMMSRALRPLNELLDSVRAIGRGSLDVKVPVTVRDDEIGALAREFNAMTGALRDREHTLATRNEELLRLKHFSDDVIRSIRIGIVILDQAGCVRSLNPAARSVLHLPLIDLEGRALAEIPDLSAPLAEVLDALAEVQEQGTLKSFPLLHLGERIVDVALVPIRDRAGASLSEVLLLGEDVTTRENTRERLLRSERLATIGRLAAQITHEIRNPLSSIGLNIELLEDDIPHLPEERRSEARAILAAVGNEVERLAQITEGYLRYARLPAPTPVAGDVGDLLADLCAFEQEEADRAGVMVELRIDEALPSVPHDPQRLRQALLNLLRNAKEAAGPGGTVRLSAFPHTIEGGVDIRIEDSGPGVSEEARNRLFEPFFTTKPKGTGLGLTLSKEIITEHGGGLSLSDSDLGGAAFEIRLPGRSAPNVEPTPRDISAPQA